MVIKGKKIPLKFDGQKMYINIRAQSGEEIDRLEIYDLTSPEPFVPEANDFHNLEYNIIHRRKQYEIIQKKYPESYAIECCKKYLALAPEDVIRKTFQSTKQFKMHVEAENKKVGQRHYKSRFPAFKEKRANALFYSDTSSPLEKGADGSTCTSQLFIGKDTDYMYVHPMKTELNSFQVLQDFGCKVSLPKCTKIDNAQTEVGINWTIGVKITEWIQSLQNLIHLGKLKLKEELVTWLPW